ncbi:MAG: VWA domain-containing protein [Elusimicrobiota bacterium]|nr:VWA domain-containing protein [Elusimicrobiota bacterium]
MIFKNYQFLYLIAFVLAAAALLKLVPSIAKKASLKISLNTRQTETLKAQLSSLIGYSGRLLAIILIIIALARPQQISKSDIPPAKGVDIILCLDTSYSMAALDFEPNRLEAAKKAASNFIRKRLNDRIGLVVFGEAAIMTCPLTLDYPAIVEFIDTTYLNMIDRKGTAVGDAIMTAVNHIKESSAKSKIIILLTDGRSNAGIISDPAYAAKIAKTLDIKIYTIGTASKGKAEIPTNDPFQPIAYINEDLDKATLMEIANITGGKFFRAKNHKDLREIYSLIDSLEKTEFDIKIFSNYKDLYPYFLFPAIILLVLVFLLERTYFMKIP